MNYILIDYYVHYFKYWDRSKNFLDDYIIKNRQFIIDTGNDKELFIFNEIAKLNGIRSITEEDIKDKL